MYPFDNNQLAKPLECHFYWNPLSDDSFEIDAKWACVCIIISTYLNDGHYSVFFGLIFLCLLLIVGQIMCFFFVNIAFK